MHLQGQVALHDNFTIIDSLNHHPMPPQVHLIKAHRMPTRHTARPVVRFEVVKASSHRRINLPQDLSREVSASRHHTLQRGLLHNRSRKAVGSQEAASAAAALTRVEVVLVEETASKASHPVLQPDQLQEVRPTDQVTTPRSMRLPATRTRLPRETVQQTTMVPSDRPPNTR
jgi:hypothetical protein